MSFNKYIGHPSQLMGVEEYRLIGSKGDGMRLMTVRNASGLEVTVSPDRACDISRVIFKGSNMNYISATGYVAPAYYDSTGTNWLKSFNGGFLTTCGLTAVGAPCVDEGEALPLHGSIANTPCEHVFWFEDDESFTITAETDDSVQFGDKMHMTRRIRIAKESNTIELTDRIENRSDRRTPLMVLYHMNMGYPLLSEKSEVTVNSVRVEPRNGHAAEDLGTWDKMLEPTPGFEEQCYYHYFGESAKAGIYNPDINKGLVIEFDPKVLDTLTEWKMMGIRDYVLGLEPGNCTPDGRDVLRREGRLRFLEPGAEAEFSFRVVFYEK